MKFGVNCDLKLNFAKQNSTFGEEMIILKFCVNYDLKLNFALQNSTFGEEL